MGIKLKQYWVFFFLLLLSCTVSKQKKSSDLSVTEEDYIKAYKTSVFYGCINEGTKGGFSKFLQKNNDLGLFNQVEIMFHSNVAEAITLGEVYSKKIKPFSYGDAKGGISNFSNCFLYSQSYEVDSFAKANYKRMLTPSVDNYQSDEKIGRFKYQTKTETIFTGDYGTTVHTIKSYYFKKELQASGVIKSKPGFESMADSIFSTGFSEIDNINKQLTFKQYNFHGYRENLKIDSAIRIYKQQPNGNLTIIFYKQYYNGASEDVEVLK